MNKITHFLNKLYIDKIFLKFVIVGIINTIVGSLIMFGCYNILGFSYWTSSIANLFLTSILSYFLNSRCTFNSDEKGLKSVLKFAVNISVCYLFSYVLSRQIINLFLICVSVNIRDNISMFMGMILFIISNYLGQRLIVFQR